MSAVYIDTSALGRLLLGEAGAPSIRRELERHERYVASQLVRTELRRLGLRNGLLAQADLMMKPVVLIPLTLDVLRAAETIHPESVATLDAIHLTTAVRLRDAGEISALMTYDRALATGAMAHDLEVIAPTG